MIVSLPLLPPATCLLPWKTPLHRPATGTGQWEDGEREEDVNMYSAASSFRSEIVALHKMGMQQFVRKMTTGFAEEFGIQLLHGFVAVAVAAG